MEKLIELIHERVDPDELIDILGLTTEDLTNLLYDVILASRQKFYYLIDEEEDEGE